MTDLNKKSGPTKASAREVALEILTRVEQEKSYSNLLLNQMLQKYKLERLDAALVTEIVYGTIQRLHTIDYFLSRFVAKGISKLQPWVRSLLRLSFYQMVYLERIPPHAVVNEAVNIAKKKGHQGISGLVNGLLRNVLRQKEELVIPEGLPPIQRIALLHSHPEWMVSRWVKQFGEETTELICAANNTAPKTSVRVNQIRHSREQMAAILKEAGIEASFSELSPSGLVIESGGNMALTEWYRDGDISVQDESSMLVAEMVNPQPGKDVLDCCAAPGGKTTHLAEKMGDKGRIISCDIHEHKEKLIRGQAERLKLHAIQTVVTDAALLPSRFAEASFDYILLDAPCSGLGVIRRKPDLKWSKEEREIAAICDVQHTILEAVHSLLKPGGILVYSTCTLEYEENQGMIKRFISQHPQFQLDEFPFAETKENLTPLENEKGMLQILPFHFHSDGFFIARLRKNFN